MERRQVPVLPLGRGDEAQQAEQLQAAGAEPGPRPRLHPAAVRCVDIEFRILTSPRVIRSDASQPPSYTQLFRAEEGGEGVAAGGAGSVSSLGSPPPYTSGGSQPLYTPAHQSMFVFPSGLWS